MSSVIIFGAGASHGAGDVLPSKPPLGSGLFSELFKNFPESWGALSSEATTAFETSFEGGMKVIWNKYGGAIMELMRHMALYFAQFRPRKIGSTAYASVARELKRRKLENQVTLVTLNYECLLETEFRYAGVELSYSLKEVHQHEMKILKPHGSCNFVPEGVSGPVSSIQMGRDAIIEMPVRVISNINEVIKHILAEALPPIMCLYMEGKPTQVARGTIKAIQKAAQDEVSMAKAVVVVGVHPNPQDTHIWYSIASCQGRVGYVGPSVQDFTEWAEEYRPEAENLILAEDFQTGVVQIADFIERSENAPQ